LTARVNPTIHGLARPIRRIVGAIPCGRPGPLSSRLWGQALPCWVIEMRLTEHLASHLQFTQFDIERHLLVPTVCLHGYRFTRALARESIPQGSDINDLL